MAKRSDGYYIKNINPYTKLMPHIMPDRHDSMNMTNVDISWTPVQEFMTKVREETGIRYNYMDVITASLVRLFASRPSLNRFVMNKKIYQHNDITLSFAVKKKLDDTAEDTTVKVHFTGEESLLEIKNALDKVILENTGDAVFNGVDNTAKILTNAPHWIISLAVGMLKFLDKHNILPKAIVEVSPFHNSMFITFMKSISGDAIFHHCYDFGTTGVFVAVGKDKDEVVSIAGEPKVQRMLHLGVVLDERFCDGLYFVNSMRLWKNVLANPAVLLEKYDAKNTKDNGLYDEDKEQHYKKLQKERKQKIKKEKKNHKNDE